ncbi:MAG: ABC transporter permease, partial [Oscillospiraceae bacterium]|nr:ABC transporter permease [Oscillospiraceae bacterium]
YNRATALVTALSMLLAIPFTVLLIKIIYYAMMKEYAGWLTFYVVPWVYPVSFAFGAVGFALVSVLLMRRVRKIPLAIALKNIE